MNSFAVTRHHFENCVGGEYMVATTERLRASELTADEIAALPIGAREAVLRELCAELELTPGEGGGWMLVDAETRECTACLGRGFTILESGATDGCERCSHSGFVRIRPPITVADYELGSSARIRIVLRPARESAAIIAVAEEGRRLGTPQHIRAGALREAMAYAPKAANVDDVAKLVRHFLEVATEAFVDFTRDDESFAAESAAYDARLARAGRRGALARAAGSR